MRRSVYLPDRAKLASLVAAAVGAPSTSAIAPPAPPRAEAPPARPVVDEGSFVDHIDLLEAGSVEVRLQRFVEELRDRSGAQAVFVADSEGLEIAYVGAEPTLIALLGEFTGVRRRIANAASSRRPLAMSVAVSESQWLQVFWLDDDASSPAIALVHRTQLSAEVAAKLRHIVHSILGNLR